MSKPKKEANQYDKIIKENLTNLVPILMHKVLRMSNFRIENLPEIKQQTTLEREPDFLKLVYDKDFPKGRILHLEFESGDTIGMNARMLEYIGILYKKHKKPVEQFVIFLGDGVSRMENTIQFFNLKFSFQIHSLSDFSYKEFVYSENPEEVVLGILSNFGNIKPEDFIQMILQRLVDLKGDSLETRKFLKQLEIISKLRNLQELTTQKIDNMSITFDITTDVRYKQGEKAGMEKGIEKGMERGLEKGLEKGELINSILVIRNMLKEGIEKITITRFSGKDENFIAQVEAAMEAESSINELLSSGFEDINEIAKKCNIPKIFVEAILKLKN